MKKVSSLIFTLFFIMQFAVSSSAYLYECEDLYTVNIPDEYKQLEEGNFKAEDGSTFTINYEDNSEIKFSVIDKSKKDIRENAQLIADEATGAFSALGEEGEMELVSVEKIKHKNGMSAVVTVYRTSMEKDGETVSHFQKMYEFGGVTNKYTFVYTANEEKNIDDMDDTFDSIVISEKENKGIFTNIFEGFVLGAIVLLIVLWIVKFILKTGKK